MDIKTQRLLFGGGLAIVGNTSDPDLDLPFALRSRDHVPGHAGGPGRRR